MPGIVAESVDSLPIPIAELIAAWPVELGGSRGAGSLVIPDDSGVALRSHPVSGRGFSDARLWRLQSAAGEWGLRCWPAGSVSPERLAYVRDQLQRAWQAGFHWIALPCPARPGGKPALERGGQFWQLYPWLPGEPLPGPEIRPVAFQSAARGVARLLAVWSRGAFCPEQPECSGTGESPALQRARERLDGYFSRLGEFRLEINRRADSGTLLGELATGALEVLARQEEELRRLAGECCQVTYRLQPVLTDLWRENLLFEGDRLSGIVDYGSLQVDSPLVTWARLLGSLEFPGHCGWPDCSAGSRIPDAVWETVADAEGEGRPESGTVPVDDARKQPGPAGCTGQSGPDRSGRYLVERIMRLGGAVACFTWLDWLFLQRRNFAEPDQARRRAEELFRRLIGNAEG